MIFIGIGLAVFMAVSPFFLSADGNGKVMRSTLLSREAVDPNQANPQSAINKKQRAIYPTSLSMTAVNPNQTNPQSAINKKQRAIYPPLFFSSQKFYISRNENKLNQVIGEQIENHQKGAQSQEKVSALAEETGDLVNEYEITLRQIENTRSYNEQLKKLIQDQANEMKSIRIQIEEVKKTSKNILPLMLEMTNNLAKFIKLDLPFLMEERQKRLKEIRKIMDRADVSISEKYRRLMEAYQIENEYGRTLEAYQGIQNIDGKKIGVNYLRVGRIALIYQSLDGKKQSYWDQNTKKWMPLSSRYSRAVENGIKIARKQQPPDLLKVPVPAPTTEKRTN